MSMVLYTGLSVGEVLAGPAVSVAFDFVLVQLHRQTTFSKPCQKLSSGQSTLMWYLVCLGVHFQFPVLCNTVNT